MMNSIFRRTPINLMGKMLDISSVRQRLIASNIANVMTPGYSSKDIDFEKSLKQAITKSQLSGAVEHPRHMPMGRTAGTSPSTVVIDKAVKPDIEKEMASSAENQLIYQTAVKIISGNFRSLRSVIRGRFSS